MATLFERLAGIGDETLEKIPVHGFRAMVYEFQRGNVTGAQAIQEFNLTSEQVTDAQRILTAISSAANKDQFVIQLFDLLALAVIGLLTSQYQDETYFWDRDWETN